MERVFFLLGALSSCLGVAAGAFGAHALKTRLSADMLATFEVGVRYQMYHAFGLIAVAWVLTKWPSSLATLSGWCFLIGTVLFSGSLYLLTLSGVRWLGAITPLGGVAFLVGWLCLGIGVWKAN
ncbi:MAG: DUF423 domain-containing protein [Acidobacteria bacterium]|nr:DUF423 domain-containing protein [Acidobacteriota bacterium]